MGWPSLGWVRLGGWGIRGPKGPSLEPAWVMPFGSPSLSPENRHVGLLSNSLWGPVIPNLQVLFPQLLLSICFASLLYMVHSFLVSDSDLDERQPLMEDYLWLNTTFNGRWPLMEDNLWWNITFHGRQSSMKTTFVGRQPSVQDDLSMKKTELLSWKAS